MVRQAVLGEVIFVLDKEVGFGDAGDGRLSLQVKEKSFPERKR